MHLIVVFFAALAIAVAPAKAAEAPASKSPAAKATPAVKPTAAAKPAAKPKVAAKPKKAAAKAKRVAKLPPLGPPGPFDGLYRGVLSPAPALSKPACATVPVQDFEINRSNIVTLPGVLSFEGTVTSAGFVSGVVHYFGESKAPLQGRITSDLDGTHLRAGVIDEDGGCAWTMDVKKQ